MTKRITKILGPDESEIYIQYDDEESEDLQAVGFLEDVRERTEKFKETMSSTILGYSSMVLNVVKEGMGDQLAPDSVTLEFGLQLGGEAGVPFVTKGTAQANIKVTIEWDLKKTSRG
jgi:hypothetical protein